MKKILVVEDDKMIRNALCEKLKFEKYEVMEAENGQVGLDIALKENPDCILLDIVMPVKDGISMLQDLRKTDKTNTIPVILLTNLSDSETAVAALENGVTEYLVKSDWKLEDVMQKIEQTISDK